MAIAGITSVVYDYRWLHGPVKVVADVVTFKRRGTTPQGGDAVEMQGPAQKGEEAAARTEDHGPPPRPASAKSDGAAARLPVSNQEASEVTAAAAAAASGSALSSGEAEPRVVPPERRLNISWQFGLLVILLFLVSFVVIMVLRGVLPDKSLLYSLFANMYLAGTIIFGGGPVVIPLLRNYVVDEGWVSPRDFLIGLALIQGFPGPNFNFAVYLGGLTAINGGYSAAAGAVLGYLGIFAPGLITVHGTMGVWGAIRGRRWVRSALRGVNAAAVGLIYTAVYRLWQIGFIDEGFEAGTSLANDPWWVVVTATSYVGGCWFGVSPPVAIILGGVMGLIRYGVVTSQGY
jgi:chromate transport protein ChrA